MNQATTTDAAATDNALKDAQPGSLSWRSFALALMLLLAIFAFTNPIWEEHDMNAWNENIWWSYLPIPVVVGLLLLFERKFSWPALGLEVMKMTFVKFVITYSMASVIWEFRGAPGTGLPTVPAVTDSQLPAFEVRPVPTDVTGFTPGSLCTVNGLLRNAQGQPMTNTLIYVESGLEGLRFAPPPEPIRFFNQGQGFQTQVPVIQTHQVVSMASAKGELHTAVFDLASQNRRVLNVAVIPGEPHDLMFDRPLGALKLSCSVHGAEEPARSVLVLSHPFWTRTDHKGVFRFEGLPPGTLRFSMFEQGKFEVGVSQPLKDLTLSSGSQVQVQWGATR